MAQDAPDLRRDGRGGRRPGPRELGEPVLEQAPLDDPAEEIRRAIEASRQKIAENLEILQDEVHERVDWRGWVREHPWEALGVAFAVGVLIGARPYL